MHSHGLDFRLSTYRSWGVREGGAHMSDPRSSIQDSKAFHSTYRGKIKERDSCELGEIIEKNRRRLCLECQEFCGLALL